MIRAAVVLCALAVSASARAEQSEVSFAYVPAPAAEQLVVTQPLGPLTVRGWDRPEVRIVARKYGPDVQTVERLRVKVELRDGHIEVRTGVRVAGVWQSLPLSEAGVDLTIDAPRQAALDATTFAGALEVFGLRSGAVLASSGGELRVRDVKGEVKTRALAGRQELSLIDGSVAASGVSGDVDVDEIDGDVLEVHVVEGRVTARRISSPVVRLISELGAVSWNGPLKPGGRYELVSHHGDVRLEVPRDASLRVVASAPGGVVRTDLPLKVARAEPQRLEGELHGGGPLVLVTAEQGAALLFRIP